MLASRDRFARLGIFSWATGGAGALSSRSRFDSAFPPAIFFMGRGLDDSGTQCCLSELCVLRGGQGVVAGDLVVSSTVFFCIRFNLALGLFENGEGSYGLILACKIGDCRLACLSCLLQGWGSLLSYSIGNPIQVVRKMMYCWYQGGKGKCLHTRVSGAYSCAFPCGASLWRR